MMRRIVVLFVCLFVLVSSAGCGGMFAGKSFGESVDDNVIVFRVKTALVKDPSIKARKIDVDSYKGHITLNGEVDSRGEEELAIEISNSIYGVIDVTSNLLIRTK